MVLVSNEWQNKSENVPKTTANTTTATTGGTQATAEATTSTPTTTTRIVETLPTTATGGNGTVVNANSNQITTTNCKESKTVAGDSTTIVNSINAITTESAIPETKTKTITLQKTATNDNANNEQLNEIINDKNSIEIVLKNKINEDDDKINELKNTEVGKIPQQQQQQQQQSQSHSQQQKDNNLKESLLNYNNKIKIMAENTKESPLKEEKEIEDIAPEQTLITSTHIQEHIAGNNKDLDETMSYPNSNTSTLTITAPKSIIKTQQQQQVPLSCPITPQALSSALQTALNNNNNNNNMNNNANNANNSVAAAGLQPNFLSQLALTANVAGLQTKSSTSSLPSTNNSSSTVVTNLTAKQLNQSFIMMEQSNNQNKSTDSNLLEGTTSNNSTSSASTVPAVTYDNNGQAKIVLICEGNSHPFQTRTISLTPNVECMVGRLIAKSKASENNAIFDCKVLSRKHAVIWYTPDGKFWVKDTKSSNGTFINDNKLGDEEAELHFGDIVKFGVDVLENSRKEVHGCIIACVKLYLPDGREAISIDSSAHRNQYSGEGRISYDELHRLNLYIQETSQREKVLTSKLCNIQNVLDATRKNSALCWQSMITEDQLLHRIHSLEKKLQFMEKNVPENVLRNEVLKLLDDKSSYQHTAKEALRKVYQERCDAMQMLAKMESAYTQSDNECSLLRDQIMNSKQTLQEVNTRLLRLETEYNEYKDEVARQQQEAKEQEEQRIAELTEKLRERELECKDLKKKISELLIKRAELVEDEEQLLEKQAIEKLDAAIADMDLGDDEDSSDDEDEEENEVINVEKRENKKNGGMEKIEAKNKTDHNDDKDDDNRDGVEQIEDIKFLIKTKKQNRPQLAGIFGDKLNGVEVEEQQSQEQDKNQLKNNKATTSSPPKRVKETTIMKWLQNSDLNKNEGSFDIFKAICNENEDEGDEGEQDGDDKLGETSALGNFSSKLKNVQKNLQQLEAEIENESINEGANITPAIKLECKEEEEDSSDEEDGGACAEQEFIIKRNGKSSSSKQVLSKDNKKYLLLKSSVDMLREAYNEIYHSVKERQEHEHRQEAGDKEKPPPPNIKVKTQFQAFATSPTAVANKKYHKTKQQQQQKLTPSSESDITESDSEIESITLAEPKAEHHHDLQLQEKLKEYEMQVSLLNEKLQQTELEAQHTLEIMQVECDDVKLKMQNLNKIIESLKNDKKALEEVLNENKNNSEKLQETAKTCPEIAREMDVEMEKELELEEDDVLKAINVTALEREEELITYKERLEEQQRENIDLRNEIALLKLKANDINTTKDILLKQYLPCSFVVLAIIIYLLTTYY
ncbi:sarcolemma associated protein isoform 1-T2 [Cochliomyia hominivorax]